MRAADEKRCTGAIAPLVTVTYPTTVSPSPGPAESIGTWSAFQPGERSVKVAESVPTLVPPTSHSTLTVTVVSKPSATSGSFTWTIMTRSSQGADTFGAIVALAKEIGASSTRTA